MNNNQNLTNQNSVISDATTIVPTLNSTYQMNGNSSNVVLSNQNITQKSPLIQNMIEDNVNHINLSQKDFTDLRKMIIAKSKDKIIDDNEKIYIVFMNKEVKRLCLIYGRFQYIIVDNKNCPYFKYLKNTYTYFIIDKGQNSNIDRIIDENVLISLLYYYQQYVENRSDNKNIFTKQNYEKKINDIKIMKQVVQDLKFQNEQTSTASYTYKGSVNLQQIPNGMGVMTIKEKKYTGLFKNGKPDTKEEFTIHIEDNDKEDLLDYEGKIDENFHYHGLGTKYIRFLSRIETMKYQDFSYEGKFEKNEPLTNEKFIVINDSYLQYVGTISKNYEFEGEGILTVLNDDKQTYTTYSGQLSKNKKNGNGKTFRLNKIPNPPLQKINQENENYFMIEEGTWKDGIFTEGKKFYPRNKNKKKYEGTFDSIGKPDGSAKSYNENENLLYNGKWKNGFFSGEGTFYDYEKKLVFYGTFSYPTDKTSEYKEFRISDGYVTNLNESKNLVCSFKYFNHSDQNFEGKLFLSKHSSDYETYTKNSLKTSYIEGNFKDFKISSNGKFVYETQSLELEFVENIPTILRNIVSDYTNDQLWKIICGFEMKDIKKLFEFLQKLKNNQFKAEKTLTFEKLLDIIQIDFDGCEEFFYNDGKSLTGKSLFGSYIQNNQINKNNKNNQNNQKNQNKQLLIQNSAEETNPNFDGINPMYKIKKGS